MIDDIRRSFKISLKVKVKVKSFKIVQNLYMINTQLKFEGKIPTAQNVVAFTRNYTKFFSFKANLTLKVEVKITNFVGRFDLEDQGQAHKFLE